MKLVDTVFGSLADGLDSSARMYCNSCVAFQELQEGHLGSYNRL